MTSTLNVAPLYPQVDFPADPGLTELPNLFDPEWVWPAYQQRFGAAGLVPRLIQIRQFSHSPGRLALVSYVAEWEPDIYLPSLHFVARVERGQPVTLFQFPDDPDLPGLAKAAEPEPAVKLLNRYVLAIGARRALIEVVRYRPGSRAVLRHRVSKTGFYARVVRPTALPPLLGAWELAGRSGFVVPRIAGYWADGGVIWLSEIPGKNLRARIRQGNHPDPELLLQGLATLWSTPASQQTQTPFNLARAYRTAKRAIRHAAQDADAAAAGLQAAARSLDPFVESWRPSGIAHNDFYDDQLLVLPDGRMALVDFEEAGPGDPMLDVGNFLAHLRWASRLGREKETGASGTFHHRFREAALDRFRWDAGELNRREAVCLFRICTTVVRYPRGDWRSKLAAGLALVNETLG